MKSKEELNALKNEVETLNKKLAELTEDELKQIIGGTFPTTEEVVKTMGLMSDKSHPGMIMSDSNGGQQQHKSVKVNEVLTVVPSSKTLATKSE